MARKAVDDLTAEKDANAARQSELQSDVTPYLDEMCAAAVAAKNYLDSPVRRA